MWQPDSTSTAMQQATSPGWIVLESWHSPLLVARIAVSRNWLRNWLRPTSVPGTGLTTHWRTLLHTSSTGSKLWETTKPCWWRPAEKQWQRWSTSLQGRVDTAKLKEIEPEDDQTMPHRYQFLPSIGLLQALGGKNSVWVASNYSDPRFFL